MRVAYGGKFVFEQNVKSHRAVGRLVFFGNKIDDSVGSVLRVSKYFPLLRAPQKTARLRRASLDAVRGTPYVGRGRKVAKGDPWP